MAEEQKKNPLDKLWDAFASVKMAIVLFFLISFTSIAGTILEQNGSRENNIKVLSDLFGPGLAEKLYPICEGMGLINMYDSWWFLSLLVAFGMNLLVCSIDRFPPVWKAVSEPMKPLNETQFKGFPIVREFHVKGGAEAAKVQAMKLFEMLGFKNPEFAEEPLPQHFAQKHRYARLGVYVTHLSIVVIMVGAMVGVLAGFKGQLNLQEGRTSFMAFKFVPMTAAESNEFDVIASTVEQKRGDMAAAAASLKVTEDNLRSRMRHLGIEPLGFGIKCNDFNVYFYGQSDMPKEFTSHLSVFDAGREVMNKWIEVNKPLQYKGFMFYQSSYGIRGDSTDYTYRFKLAGSDFEVGLNEEFPVASMNAKAKVVDFSPALSFDQNGTPFTYTEMMNNPAVKVELNEAGSVYTRWVAKRYPETWKIGSSTTLEFTDVWGSQYTGLQVRRDPGVWIVYLGCLIMSVGLYAAFFMSHRRLWVRLVSEKGITRVVVAAQSHKNKEGFERTVSEAVASLQQQEGGK